MRLTQERIIEIIKIADKYQHDRLKLQNLTIGEIAQAIFLARGNASLIEILENIKLVIINCTELDIEAIAALATEKAHFTPARVKHNNYMRAAQRKYKNKQNYLRDPMDLEIKNYAAKPYQNIAVRHKPLNETDEVPLIASIEAEEKTLNLNPNRDLEPDFIPDSKTELKQKFGPDFSSLPARIRLKRN